MSFKSTVNVLNALLYAKPVQDMLLIVQAVLITLHLSIKIAKKSAFQINIFPIHQWNVLNVNRDVRHVSQVLNA